MLLHAFGLAAVLSVCCVLTQTHAPTYTRTHTHTPTHTTYTQDIERGAVDTQLIAHDREVYDIAWGGVGVFATVSADGSVRVFDLR